ncbi:MAG: acetylglutamate kinase [Flavobacteriaceae bacterium]|nr:MAG: acetylglutamate kinase [Flavobacteriaceae bacterium]
MSKQEIIKIIKIGGAIINDSEALKSFLMAFSKITGPKVLVHGGGKSATKLANQMNIPVTMVDGRRVTDAETLEIITMTYAGKINKNIVAILQKNACNAMGFSGADANTIVAKKRPVKEVDFGFVGDVVAVNTDIISMLFDYHITPVFCAISHDENGQLLNTNADTIASELAIGLSKDFRVDLYYCFEKNGVLRVMEDENSIICNINAESYKELKKEKIISEGMLPKIDNCFYALEHGVSKVCIGNTGMLFNQNTKYTTVTL